MRRWRSAAEVTQLLVHCVLHMSDRARRGTAAALPGHSWECCKSSKRKGRVVQERLTVKIELRKWKRLNRRGEGDRERNKERSETRKQRDRGRRGKCNAPRPEPDRQSHSGQ